MGRIRLRVRDIDYAEQKVIDEELKTPLGLNMSHSPISFRSRGSYMTRGMRTGLSSKQDVEASMGHINDINNSHHHFPAMGEG